MFSRFAFVLLPFSVTINRSKLIKLMVLFCSEWLFLSVFVAWLFFFVLFWVWLFFFFPYFVPSNCASSKISKNIISILLLPSDFDLVDVDVAVDVPLFLLNISAYFLVLLIEKLTSLKRNASPYSLNSDNKTQSVHWQTKKTTELDLCNANRKWSQNTLSLMKLCVGCWPKLVAETADVDLCPKRFPISLSLSLYSSTFLPFYALARAFLLLLLCVEIFTEKLKTVRELLLLSWYIMLWLCVSILIPGCSLPEMRPHYCNPVYCQYWVGQTPESGIELLPRRFLLCRSR